jgi:hypothetical protein
MTITVQFQADNSLHEFPDGTDPAVIKKALLNYKSSLSQPAAQEQPSLLSRLSNSFQYGVGDPYEGAYQIGAHLIGNGEAADRGAAQREAEMEKIKPATFLGVDWARGAGNLVGMIPAIAAGAALAPEAATAGAATAAASTLPAWATEGITGAALAGGAQNLLSPVDSNKGDFWTRKAEQGAVGAVTGGALGAATKVLPGLGEAALNSAKAALGIKGDMDPIILRKLYEKMVEDGTNPEIALKTLDDMVAKSTVPPMYSDVVKDNSHQIIKAAAAIPNPSTKLLNEANAARMAAQQGRIEDAITQHISSDPYYQTHQGLTDIQQIKAGPAYKALYENQEPIINDELTSIMDRDSMKAAIARAYSIAKEEGRDPESLGFNFNGTPGASFSDVSGMAKPVFDRNGEQMGVKSTNAASYRDMGINVGDRSTGDFARFPEPENTISAVGGGNQIGKKPNQFEGVFNPNDMRMERLNETGPQIEFNKAPTIQTWDYVKRGLDDVINNLPRDPFGRPIMDERYRAINNTRKQLLNILKTERPEYGEALNTYAGPAAIKDAMDAGADFLNPHAEVTAASIAGVPERNGLPAIPGYTDSEKQGYLAGVAQKIREIVRNTNDGGDAAKKLFSKQDVRDKIQAALGAGGDYDAFYNQLTQEINSAKNSRATNPNAGSQTNPLFQGQEDLQQAANNAVIDHWPSIFHPVQLGAKILGSISDATQNANKKAIAEGITQRASRVGYEPVKNTLQEIQAAQDKLIADQKARDALKQQFNTWLTRSLNVVNPTFQENRQ